MPPNWKAAQKTPATVTSYPLATRPDMGDVASRDPRVPQSEILDTTSNIVLVHVGVDPVSSFFVHQNILCETSDFFKAAMKKEWTGENRRALELHDEDAANFQVYVTWLYRRKLAINEKDAANTREWKVLTQLYVLGERLLDGKFKDAVIDGMLVNVSTPVQGTLVPCQLQYYYPGRNSIKTLYEGTVRGSKARRLFAEIWAGHTHSSALIQKQDRYPYDFLLELAEVLMQTRTLGLSGKFQHANDPYRYYEHGDNLQRQDQGLGGGMSYGERMKRDAW